MPLNDASDPSSNDDEAIDRFAARIEKLEFVVAHLQQAIDDLSESLIAHQRQLDSMTRQFETIRNDIRGLANRESSPRTLLDDKPPHY